MDRSTGLALFAAKAQKSTVSAFLSSLLKSGGFGGGGGGGFGALPATSTVAKKQTAVTLENGKVPDMKGVGSKKVASEFYKCSKCTDARYRVMSHR